MGHTITVRHFNLECELKFIEETRKNSASKLAFVSRKTLKQMYTKQVLTDSWSQTLVNRLHRQIAINKNISVLAKDVLLRGVSSVLPHTVRKLATYLELRIDAAKFGRRQVTNLRKVLWRQNKQVAICLEDTVGLISVLQVRSA